MIIFSFIFDDWNSVSILPYSRFSKTGEDVHTCLGGSIDGHPNCGYSAQLGGCVDNSAIPLLHKIGCKQHGKVDRHLKISGDLLLILLQSSPVKVL